jgi:transmembrane sensor
MTDQSDITARAAQWIIEQDSANFPAQRREEFDRWLSESELHRETFDVLLRTWARMGCLQSAELASQVQRRTRYGRLRIKVIGIAAAILVLATAPLISAYKDTWRAEPSHTHLTTQVGEQRTFVLKDASTVALNTNSSIEIAYNARERRVELTRGEARFTVAKDSSKRPFYVHTKYATVRATGTEFNVYSATQGTSISVLEGEVEVSARQISSSVFSVKAGRQAEVTADGQLVSGALQPFARAREWPHHRITFVDEPLVEVVNELNRYFEHKIHISNPELAQQRVAVSLSIKSFDDIRWTMEKTLPVSLKTNADGSVTMTWAKGASEHSTDK